MSLRDGTKKMSKSDPSDMSRINLTDDADAIASKIRKARTDPEPLPETRRGARGAAGGARTSSTSTPRCRAPTPEAVVPSSPAGRSRRSSRRSPTSRSRSWRRSPGGWPS